MRSHGSVLTLAALATATVWVAASYPNSTVVRAGSLPQSAPHGSRSHSAIGLREVDFPYYSIRDGFDSQLNLVSDSPGPIDLTIAIYSQLGNSLLTSMTIQPSAKLPIDLRALLTSLGADVNGEFAEGSIAVTFEGTVMPVVGQVTSTNQALHVVHESEMVENDPGRTDIPPVLNGLWWNLAPGRDARIVVGNMSAMPVTADVYLEYRGQRHPSAPLDFSPHELKVLSVIQLLSQQGTSSSEAPEGGITIVQRGGVPKLIAQGKIVDSVTGFSTTLRFPSPELERASALHAVGVPIGEPSKDSPFAGMGSFTPHVVLRNLTAAPQSVSVTVEYPTAPGWNSTEDRIPPSVPGGKPISAPDPSKLTGQTELASVLLPGYSTVDTSLDSILDQLPQPIPYGSIRIQYSGAPGSMIAEVSSVEQSKDLVVDSKVENEGNGWVGSGANPWHLDQETDSVVFLTNMGDKAASIGFRIWASGVVYYLTKLRLSPHETRMIDLRKLRDARQPDPLGNLIPPGATDGSVIWQRSTNVPVAGRMVVMRRQGGVASNYDCNVCNCPSGFSGSINLQNGAQSVNVNVGSNVALCLLAYYSNPCNGTGDWQSPSPSATVTWTSGTPSVATVDPSGDVTGVQNGSSTITVKVQDDVCYWNGESNQCEFEPNEAGAGLAANVQLPTSMSSVSTTTTYSNQPAFLCNGDPVSNPNVPRWGPRVCLTYTLLDQTGKAITNSSNLTASETLTYESGQKPVPEGFSDAGLTNGTLGDTQAFFSTAGPVPSSYNLDFLQTITIKNTTTGQTWTPRQNCIKWSGPTSITITDVTAKPSCS